jgi:hypothetical protein
VNIGYINKYNVEDDETTVADWLKTKTISVDIGLNVA